MRHLEIEPSPIDAAIERREYKVVSLTHARSIVSVEQGPIDIRHATTGEPLVLAMPVDEGDASKLLWAFRTTDYKTAPRSSGMRSQSATFGFLPRVPFRRDFCTRCVMDVDQPKQTAAFQELGRKASAIYERHYPESFARLERSVHEEILPDWRMHGMVYTSAIVNKNNMLTYHRDAANYAGMWSAMYAYSGPAGGQLVIPELGVAFAFQTPTLIFFDGQRWLHGVAPVRRTSSIQRRYSVVFYCMRALRGCLSGPEELKRIRQVREQRERDRLHARVPAFMAPGKGKVPASVAIVSTGHLNIPDALWDEYGPRADWIALSTKAPRSKVPWGMTKHTATRRPDGKVDHWSLSITEQTASLLQRYESVLLVFSRKHAECFAAVRRILPRDTQAIEIK